MRPPLAGARARRLAPRVAAALALAGAALAAVAQPIEPTTSRLVVQFRQGPAAAKQAGPAAHRKSAAALATRAGVALAYVRAGGDGSSHVLGLPGELPVSHAHALAQRLAADPGVHSVFVDRRARRLQAATELPDDEHVRRQWPLLTAAHPGAGVGGARLLPAWPLARGRGVVVAVVDSGYVAHSDLAGQIAGGYDFVSDARLARDGDGRDPDYGDPGDGCAAGTPGCSPWGEDSSWHGTNVAGLIAARADNAAGIAGAAPDAVLLMARALGAGGGWLSDIADAIRWSAGLPVWDVPTNPRPARVVNLSLGTADTLPCPGFLADAVRAARAQGATVVAAAGNGALDAGYAGGVNSPANCPGAIAVAAHGRDGDRADYSNHGAAVTLTAPAGGACASLAPCAADPTLSTSNAGRLQPGAETVAAFVGTSAATPHVAAAAALLLSVSPALSPDAVASSLTSTAAAHPPGSWCAPYPGRCGAGMLDALAAVQREAGRLGPTVAVAGRARDWAAPGSTVRLRALGTSQAGRALAYAWRQVSGVPAAAAGHRTDELTVTVPADREPLVFEVTVTDSAGLAARTRTSVAVNQPPVLTAPPAQQLMAGRPVQLLLGARDADGDTVRFGLLAAPAGVTLDAASGALHWTPGADQVGTHAIVAAAYDGREDSSGQATLSVSVWAPMTAPAPAPGSPPAAVPPPSAAGKRIGALALPVAALTDRTVVRMSAAQALRLTLVVADPEQTSFALKVGPPGMRVDAATGVLHWPDAAAGEHRVEVDVTSLGQSTKEVGSAGVQTTRTLAFAVRADAALADTTEPTVQADAPAPPAGSGNDLAPGTGTSTAAGAGGSGGGGGAAGWLGLLMLAAAAAAAPRPRFGSRPQDPR